MLKVLAILIVFSTLFIGCSNNNSENIPIANETGNMGGFFQKMDVEFFEFCYKGVTYIYADAYSSSGITELRTINDYLVLCEE